MTDPASASLGLFHINKVCPKSAATESLSKAARFCGHYICFLIVYDTIAFSTTLAMNLWLLI